MTTEHLDVLIVGAGLSGIGAAWHLQDKCPGRSFALIEARDVIGGTWDLFRYPGVRSDSDMYTLGYSFRPWTGEKSIADGPSILAYIRDTAAKYGIDRKIRFQHRLVRASWSSEEARWTLDVERGPERAPVRLTAAFLVMCPGYYRYEEGYTPDFPGIGRFKGELVHPQKWSDDITTKGKRVVVVGSGATAVTLVPEIARDAAHVTMLQRSPGYVAAWPDVDERALTWRRKLPEKLAYRMIRAKNVLRGMYIYRMCKKKPDKVAAFLIGEVKKALPGGYDVEKHFTPRYKPWDQRLCLDANSGLLRSIREGRTSVVTDEVETFTETGIRLKSGETIEADMVVTATGLALQVLGGAEVRVDGRKVEANRTIGYKGAMYSDIPNLASVFGYTNASWTLKADLVSGWICRLLNHMARRGIVQATPRNKDASLTFLPWVDFSSGYIKRAEAILPRQGSRKPWRLYQNYALDMLAFRWSRIEDGVLEMRRAPRKGLGAPAGDASGTQQPAKAA